MEVSRARPLRPQQDVFEAIEARGNVIELDANPVFQISQRFGLGLHIHPPLFFKLGLSVLDVINPVRLIDALHPSNKEGGNASRQKADELQHMPSGNLRVVASALRRHSANSRFEARLV